MAVKMQLFQLTQDMKIFGNTDDLNKKVDELFDINVDQFIIKSKQDKQKQAEAQIMETINSIDT